MGELEAVLMLARPCSSTASSAAAAATRPPCWPRWPHEPPSWHAASIKVTELAEGVAGCEDGLATS